MHVLGARIGREPPPSAKLTAKKDLFIRNTQYAARDTPNLQLPYEDTHFELAVWLYGQAQVFRRGRCDPEGTRALVKAGDLAARG